MTDVNTQSQIKLIGIIATFTLLSACGAGTDVNTETPEIGQAVETVDSPTPTNIPVAVPAVIPVETNPIETIPIEVTPIELELELPTTTPTTSSPTEIEIGPVPAPVSEPIATSPQPLPAEPELEPAPATNVSCMASSAEIQSSTLSLINNARAIARSCGNTFFEAAGPLTWNSQLASAARVHSEDMATTNFFSHTGSDGLSVSQRVDAQQYNWRTVGENIAAGQPTTQSVVDAWLDSPGHCENLMNPNFEETAVTCVENTNSQYLQYWTNVLGSSF